MIHWIHCHLIIFEEGRDPLPSEWAPCLSPSDGPEDWCGPFPSHYVDWEISDTSHLPRALHTRTQTRARTTTRTHARHLASATHAAAEIPHGLLAIPNLDWACSVRTLLWVNITGSGWRDRYLSLFVVFFNYSKEKEDQSLKIEAFSLYIFSWMLLFVCFTNVCFYPVIFCWYVWNNITTKESKDPLGSQESWLFLVSWAKRTRSLKRVGIPITTTDLCSDWLFLRRTTQSSFPFFKIIFYKRFQHCFMVLDLTKKKKPHACQNIQSNAVSLLR